MCVVECYCSEPFLVTLFYHEDLAISFKQRNCNCLGMTPTTTERNCYLKACFLVGIVATDTALRRGQVVIISGSIHPRLNLNRL